MAETKITSKSEFATLTATLKTKLPDLKSDSDKVKTALSSVTNYDGIDVSGAAKKISSNIDNIYKDFETTTLNINNYATDILGFDVNDFLAKGGDVEIKYDDLFKTDGTMAGNAQVVWNFLKYKGLSDAAIAGVMGNIQAECSFRLDANGDGGTSYGLIQWHAGRKTALLNWLDQHGYAHDSLRGQLEYLWYEALDPNSHYGPSLKSAGFYSTKDPVEAAVAFHNVVERSASSQDTVRSRRGGFATQWYNKFKGTAPGFVDGELVISDDANSLLNNKTNQNSYSNTNAYVSGGCGGCGSSGGCGSISSPGYTPTVTTPLSVTSPTVTVDSGSSRGELLSSMSQVKAQKVNLNFGKKDVDTSKFKDYPDLGLKVSTGHMSYELTDDDIDLLCSIVAASGGKGYDDSLSIISSILNRCESASFMTKYGIDPVAQATASGQYTGYGSGDFKSYLAGVSSISDETKAAVKAALSGIRNHSGTSIIKITEGASSTSGVPVSSSGDSGLLEFLKTSNETLDTPVAETETTTDVTLDSSNELEELGIKVEGDTLTIE